MKKLIKHSLPLLTALILLAACPTGDGSGGGGVITGDQDPVTAIAVRRGNLTVNEGANISLGIGAEQDFTVRLTPSTAKDVTVTWTPGNSAVEVAPEADGLSATVTGKNADRSLTITVSAGNDGNAVPVKRTFTISVTDPDDTNDPYDPLPGKYQFRSVWVAAVTSDFTTVSVGEGRPFTEAAFRSAFSRVLDTCETFNMNALIFQVRPMLDAWYPSTINPWSFYLTNLQGSSPGNWDPLKIMVEETHKRGLEFHAWFNPYRVTDPYVDSGGGSLISGISTAELDAMSNPDLIDAYMRGATAAIRRLASNNWAVQNRDMVYRFNRALYLDAGRPEVRQHVVDTIKEVIENYDVDAIHFDDYFYPYSAPYAALSLSDQATFDMYGDGYTKDQAGREQWWRDNNTRLIQAVKDAIKAENSSKNKAIQFGVSPFGIWRNGTQHGGSATTGSQTYTGQVYADTRQWVLDELVDYMAPQLYWDLNHGQASYSALAPWWSDVVSGKNVHLYIGHANYKYIQNSSEAAWQNSSEILNQLKFNNNYSLIKGSSLFSYQHLVRTDAGTAWNRARDAAGQIKTEWGAHKTIVPPKTWLNGTVPARPMNVSQNGPVITWDDTVENNARYYVVYRALTQEGKKKNRIKGDPANIITRVWGDKQTSFEFTDDVQNPEVYMYVVTALNAAHVESRPCAAVKQ